MTLRSDYFRLFFEIVDSPEAFQFRETNLAKFFYDQHVRQFYDYSISKRKKTENLVQRLLESIRTGVVTLKMLVNFGVFDRRPRTLVYGHHRSVEIKGVLYDTYNKNVVDTLERTNCILLEDYCNNPGKVYSPDGYVHGLLPLQIFFMVWVLFLHGVEILQFASEIHRRYPRLNWSLPKLFKSSLYFYSSFRFSRWFLRSLRVKNILLFVHYGRQPWVAAGRNLSLPVVELMHGMIGAQHPHYCIPNFPHAFEQVFRKQSLPTSLGVYGSYWKEIVDHGEQFSPGMVFVVGYFLKSPVVRLIRERLDTRKVILITSQPTVQPEILAYLNFLSRELPREDYLVILKPHPAENERFYSGVLSEGFIEMSFKNVHELFSEADIHVSVHSTTLYEAIRYGLCNYSLFKEEVRDVCQEIVDAGIARPLQPDQLPIWYEVNSAVANHFFSAYDPERLLFYLNRGLV